MAPKQPVKANSFMSHAEDLVACLIFLGFDGQAVRTAKELGMDYEGLSNCARTAQDRAMDEADFERADRILGMYPEDPTQAQQIALGRYHRLMESDRVEDHRRALELAEIKWLGDERICQAVLKVWEDLRKDSRAQYDHAVRYKLTGDYLLIPGREIVKDLLDDRYEGEEAFRLAVELGDQELILSTAKTVCQNFIEKGYSKDAEKRALAVAQESGSKELIALALKAYYITLLSEDYSVEALETDLSEADRLLKEHKVDMGTVREWDVNIFDILMEGKHYRIAEFLTRRRERLGKSRQRKAAKARMQQELEPKGDHSMSSGWAEEVGVTLRQAGLVQEAGIQAKLLAYCLHFAEREDPNHVMEIAKFLGLNKENISKVVEKLQEHELGWGDPSKAVALMKQRGQDPDKLKELALKVCSCKLDYSLNLENCSRIRRLAEEVGILDRVTERAQAAYLIARGKYEAAEGSYSRNSWIVTAVLLAGIFNLSVDPEELAVLRRKAYWEVLVSISLGTCGQCCLGELGRACPLEQTELLEVGAEVFLYLAQNRRFRYLQVLVSLIDLPEPYGQLAKELYGAVEQ